MARVVIDGKRFLLILGLDEDTVKPETIAEALRRLSEEEMQELESCCVHVEDTLPHLNPEIFKSLKDNVEYIPTKEYDPMYTETELRKMIKYERNPMRKAMLQKELSTMNMWNGKHSRGKRKHS